MGEGGRRGQVSSALPSRLLHVDSKIPEGSTGALRFLGTRTTTFAGPDVGIGAVPGIPPAVVEWLPCRTAIAVAFRQIGKMFGAVEGALLSVDAVPGSAYKE